MGPPASDVAASVDVVTSDVAASVDALHIGPTSTTSADHLAATEPLRTAALHALPPELGSLPPELLVEVFQSLGARHTLPFLCVSKPMRLAALSDAVWESHLQLELGFTSAGIALWRLHGGTTLGVAQTPSRGPFPSWFPNSLLACWHYFTYLHEALEVEPMSEAKPAACAHFCACHAAGTPHWEGCSDVRLELRLGLGLR